MPYGLTVTDIVSSFSGAVESDFATASLSGSEVITNEINMNWLKLKSLLRFPLIDHVENEVVTVKSDFSFNTHYVPVDGTLHIKGSVEDCNSSCYCSYDYSSNLGYMSGGTHCGNYVVRYDVAEEDQHYARFILRDMVCSSLGNRIYLQGNADVASIVTYYSTQADNWIKLLQDGYDPFPKKPTKNINTIKMHRS